MQDVNYRHAYILRFDYSDSCFADIIVPRKHYSINMNSGESY